MKENQLIQSPSSNPVTKISQEEKLRLIKIKEQQVKQNQTIRK